MAAAGQTHQISNKGKGRGTLFPAAYGTNVESIEAAAIAYAAGFTVGHVEDHGGGRIEGTIRRSPKNAFGASVGMNRTIHGAAEGDKDGVAVVSAGEPAPFHAVEGLDRLGGVDEQLIPFRAGGYVGVAAEDRPGHIVFGLQRGKVVGIAVESAGGIVAVLGEMEGSAVDVGVPGAMFPPSTVRRRLP